MLSTNNAPLHQGKSAYGVDVEVLPEVALSKVGKKLIA